MIAWLLVGLIIYFTYSLKHSKVQRCLCPQKQIEPPNQNDLPLGGRFCLICGFRRCLRTELVEGANEFARDLLRGCLLNHKSLHQVTAFSREESRLPEK